MVVELAERRQGLTDKPGDVRKFQQTVPTTGTQGPFATVSIGWSTEERRTIALSTFGPKPSWLPTAVGKLNDLLALRNDWDSYKGLEIAPGSVLGAAWLLASVSQPDSPEPLVVPSSRSGVQLEWHERGVDIEVLVLPNGAATLFYLDATSNVEDEREGDVRSIRPTLANALRGIYEHCR